MECPICFNNIKNLTKKVVCFCGFQICLECAKKYLLTIDFSSVSCMNCKVEWTPQFLYQHFPKSWLNSTNPNGYRTYQKKMIFERENSKIQETLAQVPKEKEQRELLKKRDILMVSINKHTEKLEELKKQENWTFKKEIKSKIKTIKKAIDLMKDKLLEIYNEFCLNRKTKNDSNYNYLRPCLQSECKGMIKKEDFVCVICGLKVCEKCYESLNQNESLAPVSNQAKGHVCDLNNLETIKTLAKNTKPCPKCAVSIQKNKGCDQMWCVVCKTAYSWDTGIIETGIIHNPIAIRWHRENGTLTRTPGDFVCGGLLPYSEISIPKLIPGETKKKLYNIYKRLNECQNDILFFNGIQYRFDKFRLQFVMGDFSEKTWQRKIFSEERLRSRNKIRVQILETFFILGTERFRDLYESRVKIENVMKLIEEMDAILKYINECFEKELFVLGSRSSPQIDYQKKLKIRCK